ncbi:MAG: TM0106 family RecB-like putative nuclease [Chloroflexi bacterium]|nr:TM0106 family RecB-like putative nuclease [Chloroflexota bacterium]
MSNPIITAYTLRYLSICERRIWLDHAGDPLAREIVPVEAFAGGIRHEEAVSAAMFGKAMPVVAVDWRDLVEITRSLMEQGVAGIRGAAFERTLSLQPPVTVRGRVDWLRRVAQPSRLGGWCYEPVEIKLRKEVSAEDRLQLDFYVWLLNEAQGVEPSGWFWMGRDSDNRPLNVVEHRYDKNRLMAALGRATDLLAAPAAPPVFLGSHCQTCPWKAACTQAAADGRSVALLPGLSRQTWMHMQRDGVHTLDDILALPPQELSRFKGVGKTRALELHAHARAVVSGMPVPRCPLPEKTRLPGVMLDLETRMDDGGVWCFGWQGADGQTRVAIVDAYCDADSLTLPDGQVIIMIRDSDEGWRLVADAASELPGPVYHWGSFEKGVLRSTAPTDVVRALDDRLHDLNRTFRQTMALPVRGTSIKKVAPYLGFHWPEGTDAFTAWADYNAWLLDGNARRLARACAYNRADVDALALIWQWMVNNSL